MDSAPDDIQARVFQTTLAEIESSRQTISEIKTTGDSSSSNSNNNNEEINCCVICLDTISEPCTSLPCSHTNFDFICLLNWLQQRATCPLCKSSITQVQYSSPDDDPKNGPTKTSIYSVPKPASPPPPPPPLNTTTTNNTHPSAPPFSSSFSSPSSTRFIHQLHHRHGHHHRRRPPHQTRTSHPPPSPDSDSALSFRRHVYAKNLYSLHVGSNRFSSRSYLPAPPSPQILSSTPHLLSRARLWIRRELQVFSFLQGGPSSSSSSSESSLSPNREFLLEYIVAILKTVDLQDSSGQAEALLEDFLLDKKHARLFCHELKHWLRSPARTLEVWDREVRYPDADESRKRRGVNEDEDEDEEEEEDEGKRRQRRERVDGGRSWEDAGGDHWRPAGEGHDYDDERENKREKKRKRRME